MLLMCFCHTIAARYGALAGFGLSLAKWTLIVKRSTDLVRDENAWLWWLVLAFGFLICIRFAYFGIVKEKIYPLLCPQGDGAIPSDKAILATSFHSSQGTAFLLLLKTIPGF